MKFPANIKILSSSNTILSIILILAFLIRVWGIKFGLPYPYHPDEEQYILMSLKMGKYGLNPHYFINPSLYTYLLLFANSLYYLFGLIWGTFLNPGDFITHYSMDPTNFFIIARGTSVLFSLITIVFVYKTTKTLLNETTGLLSALILTFLFLHVRDSHFAVPDITMICFLTITFYYLVRFYKINNTKDIGLSGLFMGLAFATKYTSILLLPMVALIIFMKDQPRINGKLVVIYILITTSAFMIGFFVGCPYAFLDFKEFWSDFNSLFHYSKAGWFGIGTYQNGYLFYFKCLQWGIGWPILLLWLFSCFYLFSNNIRIWFLLYGFPIVFFLYIGKSHLQFERFLLPLIPFVSMATALATFQFVEDVKISKPVLILFLLFFLLIPAICSFRYDYLLSQIDTRTQAKEWIDNNLPEGSKIAVDGYGPILHITHPKIAEYYSAKNTKLKFEVNYLGRFGLGLYPLDYYKKQNYYYLISSNYTYERYMLQHDLFPKEVNFYQNLDKNARLLKSFSPFKDSYNPPFRLAYIMGPSEFLFQFKQPGPLIKIYALDSTN